MPTQHTVKAYDQELTALTSKILEMGGLVEHQISQSIDALRDRDLDMANEAIELDDRIDRMEEEIDQYAIRLFATRQPVAVDLRLVAMAMKISNDLERIGDYASNIASRCERLTKSPPLKPLYAIPRMSQLALAMVKDVLDAYVDRDVDKAIAVWHRDDEVDEMYTSLLRELLTYMMEDPRNISPCIDLLFVAKNLERIADHTTNIAEQIHYIMHGERINRMPTSVSQA
ncbi:MAG TPA: phosphate signaling complex protein PhoU [Geminicoccaceae bacterium]|nr:phosphate signaling complex protein PhoU [Geminicoccaceae bacterium]